MAAVSQRHRRADGQTDGRTDGRVTVAIPRDASGNAKYLAQILHFSQKRALFENRRGYIFTAR